MANENICDTCEQRFSCILNGNIVRQKCEIFTKDSDTVRVVRCKDCIHFNPDNVPAEKYGFCELLSRTYYGEHYCADGERK